MLAHQRQSAIYDTVRKRGGARIAELMRQFGVSQITIRRDLEVLADRGLVGGAPAAYVCQRFVCQRPVTTPAELRALLEG